MSTRDQFAELTHDTRRPDRLAIAGWKAEAAIHRSLGAIGASCTLRQVPDAPMEYRPPSTGTTLATGAERVKASITRYLTNELRLVVNQEKSRIVASDEVEYLGFAFRGSRATIQVASKAIQKFKHRIRELTSPSRGIR